MTTKNSTYSPFVKQCFVTAAICCNIAGHGCILGFPGVLLPKLHKPGSPIPLSGSADSWIASVIGVMLLVGSFVTPPMMSRYGRKLAHITLTVPALIGWFICIYATSFEMLFIGRIFQGLSFGMFTPLRSILIGEYSSPRHRGAFLTMVSFSQTFGIFFVHIVGSIMSWQHTALVCLFFPFFSLVMTIYTPESPVWLASQGEYDKSRKAFRWLRGNEEEVELEAMINVQTHADRKEIGMMKKEKNYIKKSMTTLKKKEFYIPITVIFHIFCMVHFCGGITMSAYATKIIGLIMGSEVNAHFWMIQLDTQRLIVNAFAVYVIRKAKRRTILFSVGAVSVISHIAIALYVYLKTENLLSYDGQWIPVLLINIQICTVGLAMGGMPSVIAGEIYPLKYKSIGSTFNNWILSGFMFIALKTFPTMIESTGLHGTYVIYAGILTFNLVVTWFILPETKDKTLQQIEEELRGKPLIPNDVAETSVDIDPETRLNVNESIRRLSN